ncbi:MAG: heavy-metal-associated domain-containing protein [Burkholderiales bacterium]|nr:heavy-metal-associated domain-containing protein [Burkholderiales bacterium]
MIAFEVRDMTCGHCAGTITKAVEAADPGARVDIDLAAHRVQIQPAASDAQRLARAITEAGYTPVAAAAEAPIPGDNTAGRRGCCCR